MIIRICMLGIGLAFYMLWDFVCPCPACDWFALLFTSQTQLAQQCQCSHQARDVVQSTLQCVPVQRRSCAYCGWQAYRMHVCLETYTVTETSCKCCCWPAGYDVTLCNEGYAPAMNGKHIVCVPMASASA